MVANSDQPVAKSPLHPGLIDVNALTRKYAEERHRRQRSDGLAQNVELEETDKLASLAEDPFVDHDALKAEPPALEDGQEVQVIVLGAGFGGLLFAARLIEAGIAAEGIRIIDFAGGFGGTWYWNRYPGVMCDTEACVYCPLLEETSYMPKNKYAYGEEIRGHTERIARHYGLADKAVFRTKVISAEWNDETRRWVVKMEQSRGPGHRAVNMTAYAQFFCLCNGVLNHPKAPKVPGLENFEGQMFHASRWNYAITGGSPADQTLSNLQDKRVGILGTGPTSIQAVPKLAEFSKEVYVFQRTPSSIGYRGQRATDPVEWKTMVATKPGWQLERMNNFDLLAQGEPADDPYFTDGWTNLKAFSAFTGRSDAPVMTKDDEQEHIDHYLALDAPSQEAIRRRVDQVVHDRRTADALKPWYPTWCKRPGFHDEYLETFNLPNVHLVDIADTKGITGASTKGLIGGGQEVELDVLILSTGFRPLIDIHNPDPGSKSNTVIVGRNSVKMADKWAVRGAATLHGCMTSSFPNLFLSGTAQVSGGPNYTSLVDTLSRQVAYIVTESLRRAEDPSRVAVEPSVEAEEAWVAEVLKYDRFSSPITVCTPGYFNSEGEGLRTVPEEEELKRRRNSSFMKGVPVFRKVLGDWRTDGRMDGIVFR
ncbi:Pentalenolactone D synthase [Cytospora mali]|uniref:Pentalenolactone D synthase n=1 Tax=Cytospora mali TaxID=578113 RepID=A0A194V9T7_CYTMA|nr:Pentalenolactone D synthase [Valsa mali var. pyri (nom. inval.)]